MDVVYEFGIEEMITCSLNDPYEKNVVETILDISYTLASIRFLYVTPLQV